MSTTTESKSALPSLRTILLLDAASGLGMALPLTMATGLMADLTGLPASLLLMAGLSLFPVAAFMIFVGTRNPIPAAGVWTIILGNAAWVAASLVLLKGYALPAFGAGFILLQAATVSLLAALEYAALKTYSTVPAQAPLR